MSEEIKQQNNYNESSIDDISQIQGARLRPQSIGFEGHSHVFTEQLANSIDEAREGYGKIIEITKYEDDSISVRDYGRSIPLDYNPKTQKFNWKTIFLTMWGGGKYSNSSNKEKSNYSSSLGCNGAGNFGSATTSQFFEVWSYKGNECHNIRFEEGKIIKEFNKYEDNTTRGTKTHFKPDIKCYGEDIIDDEFITDMLKRQSIINGGIKFIYINKKNSYTKEYYYENGILDYIREISKEKEFTNVYNFKGEAFVPSKPQDFEADYEIYFTFNNSINLMEYYHNSSYLPNGGLPEKVIKNSMVDIFDKYIKTNNLYKKGEKIKFDDIVDSLIIVFSSGSTTSIFADQTKKSIDHKELQKVITEEFKNYLEILLIENKLEADKIVNQLLINMTSRIKADNTRLEEKKKNKTQLGKKVEKLTDCTSNNPTECEIYLVEGDSSGGNAKQARNRRTQAVLPQRGKSKNTERKSKNEATSEDLKNIENSLQCGTKNNYKEENLKFYKVILLADGDSDGAGHITTLWITYFYREMKDLILNGHLYIAIPPLFKNVMRIEKGNEIIEYTYMESEQLDFLKCNNPIRIQRYKGVGEMSSKQLEETVMNKKTRRLIQVEINDDKKANDIINMLMSNVVAPRYEFIMKNGKFKEK